MPMFDFVSVIHTLDYCSFLTDPQCHILHLSGCKMGFFSSLE